MTAEKIVAIVFMCLIGFFILFGLIYSVSIDVIQHFKEKKELQKQKEECIAKMFSAYTYLQIQNYILQKNEDKYLKEISRLKSQIKKLKVNSVKQNEK